MYVFNTLHMHCSTFLMYSENNYCVLSTLHMHCSTFVMYLVNKNRVLSTLHRYCSSLQMYCINFVMNCSTFVMYCSTRFWAILTENPFQRYSTLIILRLRTHSASHKRFWYGPFRHMPPLYSTAKTNTVYLSNNLGHHAPMTVIIIIRGGELHISIGNGMVNRLPSRQRLGRRGGDELRWRRVGG